MSHFHGLSNLKNYITPINLEIIARLEKKLSGIRVKKFEPLKVHKFNNSCVNLISSCEIVLINATKPQEAFELAKYTF